MIYLNLNKHISVRMFPYVSKKKIALIKCGPYMNEETQKVLFSFLKNCNTIHFKLFFTVISRVENKGKRRNKKEKIFAWSKVLSAPKNVGGQNLLNGQTKIIGSKRMIHVKYLDSPKVV